MSWQSVFYFKDSEGDPLVESLRSGFISAFCLEDDLIPWITRMREADRIIDETWSDVRSIHHNQVEFVFSEEGDITGARFVVKPTMKEVAALSHFTDMTRGAWVEDNPVWAEFSVQNTSAMGELMDGSGAVIDRLDTILSPTESVITVPKWKWLEGDVLYINPISRSHEHYKFKAKCRSDLMMTVFINRLRTRARVFRLDFR